MKFKKNDKVILLNDQPYNQYYIYKNFLYKFLKYDFDGNALLMCTEKKDSDLSNHVFKTRENNLRKRTIKEIFKGVFKNG